MSNWIKVIDGSTESGALALHVDSAGMIYVAGASTEDNNNRLFVAKYDTDGTLQWDKALGDNSTTITEGDPAGIATDSSGNVYVAFAWAAGGIMLVKLNSSGVDQWWRQWSNWEGSNNFENDFTVGLAVDSTDNVYVAGRVAAFGYLAKYNSSGTYQWNREIRSGAQDNPIAKVYDVHHYNGDLYLSGENNTWRGGGGVATNNFDMHAIKITGAGSATIIDSRRYDANRTESLVGNRITLDSDGNIFLLDTNRDEIHKITSAGSYSWTRSVTGSFSASDIAAHGTDVYVVGQSSGDAVILRIDSAGDLDYERLIEHSTLSIGITRVTVDSEFLYLWGLMNGDFILAKIDREFGYTGTQGSFTLSDPAAFSLSTVTYTAGQNPNVATTTEPDTSSTDRTATDITMSETDTSLPVTHLAQATLASTTTLSATGSRLIQNFDPYDWDSLSGWDDWPLDIWDRPNWRPSSEFAVIADGLIIVPGAATLSSEAALTATGGLSLGGSADLDSEAAISTQASIALTGSAEFNSTFTSAFAGRLGFNTSIFVDSFADLSVDALIGKIGEATLASESALNAQGLKTINASAELNSTATIFGDLQRLVFAEADLNTSFSVTVDAIIVIAGASDVTSTATVSATGSVAKFGEAQLSGFAAVLGIGEITNLLQFLYVIEQETRVFKIHPESREYDIEQETRTFIV